MKKLLAIAAILAVPLMAVPFVSAGNGNVGIHPDAIRPPLPSYVCAEGRFGRQLAAYCLLEGMRAGAFESMQAVDLAVYCREAAKLVCQPDITPDPELFE